MQLLLLLLLTGHCTLQAGCAPAPSCRHGRDGGDAFSPRTTRAQVPVPELQQLAVAQPLLLLVAPSTLRTALGVLTEGGARSLRQCLDTLVEDPGGWGVRQ